MAANVGIESVLHMTDEAVPFFYAEDAFRLGDTWQDMASAFASVLRAVLENKGSDSLGSIWQSIHTLRLMCRMHCVACIEVCLVQVPFMICGISRHATLTELEDIWPIAPDALSFLKKVSAARVEQLAPSYNSTALVALMLDNTYAGVLHPLGCRLNPMANAKHAPAPLQVVERPPWLSTYLQEFQGGMGRGYRGAWRECKAGRIAGVHRWCQQTQFTCFMSQ